MPISSMTGFARQNGSKNFSGASFDWFWEVKSVNGKALDVKMKLPNRLDGTLSVPIKNLATKYFRRGCFCIYLDLKAVNHVSEVKINQELLDGLAVKAIELVESFGEKIQKPSAAELLAFKGVVEVGEEDLSEEDNQVLQADLLADFEETCRKLQIDRAQEGEKMKTALLDIINKVANIVEKIERIAVSQPEKLKEKLQAQLNEWLDPANMISEERLTQELVLYVARADIREEIDRLKAHIKTARELLNCGEAVGRRLDFLCQELNREANTTCSKSGDIEQTHLGMELKMLIEQFREQVQNIE